MRPGGTQKKHGAAVRMRRRLGLAPRAYVLLSCSLALVVAGVSAYGLAVPPMVQARTARELRVGHKAKSDLGTTTGYAWASVVAHVVFGVDDAGSAEAPDNEIALANGKTIVLTNTKIIHHLSDNSVSAVVNKAEQQKGQDTQQSGKPGGSGSSGSSSDSSNSSGDSGSGSGSGSASGGSGSNGSTGGSTGGNTNSSGLSAAEEESIHSWTVMSLGPIARSRPITQQAIPGRAIAWPTICLSFVPSLAGKRFLPSQSGISNTPTYGAATPTCANGWGITAMTTSRSTTSIPTWRRSPYDE